ncbi:hypothetical protein GCM10010389_62810 [Streptomyces echinoruber]|uniref:Uncharacterized protein n=1 Tax=Streptomyces echinoruber TaxID=68898 RepID=A0A918RWX2_9ACTN|nr:hypothetical protein GCM10010389_62810 [Streptomyces echinoruber]
MKAAPAHRSADARRSPAAAARGGPGPQNPGLGIPALRAPVPGPRPQDPGPQGLGSGRCSNQSKAAPPSVADRPITLPVNPVATCVDRYRPSSSAGGSTPAGVSTEKARVPGPPARSPGARPES